MSTHEQTLRRRYALEAEERYRRCEKYLDTITEEQRRTRKTAEAQLTAAVNAAFQQIDSTEWENKGQLHLLKTKHLASGLGLLRLCTREVAAIRYRIHRVGSLREVWMTSNGTLCITIPVSFLTGEYSVLVPVNDRHVRIPPEAMNSIAQTLNF